MKKGSGWESNGGKGGGGGMKEGIGVMVGGVDEARERGVWKVGYDDMGMDRESERF